MKSSHPVIETRQVMIQEDPFLAENVNKPWQERGLWPAAWIAGPNPMGKPIFWGFRKKFAVDQPQTIRIHVSADERYELYLDGSRIGRGSERGAPDAWFYETYELGLTPGEHLLFARVWALGLQSAQAQMSVEPGFLLAAEGNWLHHLSTGLSAWEACRLDGYELISPFPAHWRGWRFLVNGSKIAWGIESGLETGAAWEPATVKDQAAARRMNWDLLPRQWLTPAMLPALWEAEIRSAVVRHISNPGWVNSLDQANLTNAPIHLDENIAGEAKTWQDVLAGGSTLTIPTQTTRRIIIDLENYFTAFPRLQVSGGAGSLMRVNWAESLFEQPVYIGGSKGNRDAIDGKYFLGFGDAFTPDGGQRRVFEPLWWMAGRYLEILVQTGNEPLVIEDFYIIERRYPLECDSSFQASDHRLAHLTPLLLRGLQMCANETYFDCPYYEEMMYSGDTRLEMLVTYMMSRDVHLPRKALRMFDVSRQASGMTHSRYPTRIKQIIAPFSLWWVGMVSDYVWWRGDLAFVGALMPGVRATLEGYRRFLNQDGLVQAPEGWNTLDWVPEWSLESGAPPDAVSGVSGLLNWHYAYTLVLASRLEQALGETELAARNQRLAGEIAEVLLNRFWDTKRGLFADDLQHDHFSEHSQCMALLSGLLPVERQRQVSHGLLNDPDLARTTIYFSHYLFETLRILDRVDILQERLGLWFGLLENGLKTPVEMPEPSRSDCHAWGAHPYYHYFATILGIRPDSLGFKTVRITPRLGSLEWAQGKLPHPGGGVIEVECRRDANGLHSRVRLPEDLTGWLDVGSGQMIALDAGETVF